MIDPRFFMPKAARPLADWIAGLDVSLADPAMGEDLIETPAALAGSQPGQITYLASKRHLDYLDTARATACLCPEKLADKVAAKGITPVFSTAPRAHFARLCGAMIASAPATPPQIDPSAKVHAQAVIGPGVVIGPRTEIGAFAVVEFALIGADCKIKSGAVIGGQGFGVAGDADGLVDIPHFGRVVIGERVTIGAQSCIDRGQLGDTVLGDDVKIDNLVQVAHNVHIGARSMLAGHVGISGSCVIGEDCQLGGRVGLADHIQVGDKAILAAGAGVMHNIPAGEMWSGVPAMPIREHMKMVAATKKLIKQKPS